MRQTGTHSESSVIVDHLAIGALNIISLSAILGQIGNGGLNCQSSYKIQSINETRSTAFQ